MPTRCATKPRRMRSRISFTYYGVTSVFGCTRIHPNNTRWQNVADVDEGQIGENTMKLHRPIIARQIIARVFEGEPREYVVAAWPEGQPLPAKVVNMIMGTWTPDGSWVERDGSILYVQERRQRGCAD